MIQRTCALCYVDFPAHHKRMIYCSKGCNAKASYRRKRDTVPLPLSDEFTCSWCEGFVPAKKKSGPVAKYCSARCRQQANYAAAKSRGTIYRPPLKPRRRIECATCSVGFESSRDDARFCSRRCLQSWGRANEKGRCSEVECDRPVRAKCLCNKHYKASLRADGRLSTKAPWTDARRDAWHKRRALKKGASTGEPVRLAEIAERDGWACGICCGAVDPDARWPEPLSKSLDHVVPLTRGGAHDPSNVQLAHLRCNVAKGDRVT